jgi:hypothetical protein
MRAAIGIGAVMLALALAPPANAQQSVVFGGQSGTVVNQPLDTSASVVPINTIQLYDHSNKLFNFLPAMHFPQSRPVFGKSTFPTEPDGSFGMTYLKAFGFQGKPPPHPSNGIFISLFGR